MNYLHIGVRQRSGTKYAVRALVAFILVLGLFSHQTFTSPAQFVGVGLEIQTRSFDNSLAKRVISNGTIVISLETLEEFESIVLPTLAYIQFEAVVTLLYDGLNLADICAVTATFMKGNISFRYVDVSAYWDLTERELALSTSNLTGGCTGWPASYRSMCAFWIFHVHHVLSDYRWYWRLDTDSRLLAPVTRDVFKWAEENREQFVGVQFYPTTTCSEGLVDAIQSWLQHRPKNETYAWLPAVFSDPGDVASWTKNVVNTHFELIDMDLMRTESWRSFSAMINATGGIWTTRWGDHQIKTLYAGLFWSSMKTDDRTLVPSYSHQEFHY